jgi:LCP family protein required for cell wall assembly
MTETSPPKRKRSWLSTCLIWVMVISFTLAAGIIAYFVFTTLRDTAASLWKSPPGPSISDEIQPPPPEIFEMPDLNAPLQPDSGPAPQPWDGESRATMLILGLDYRDWELDQGPPRTDTMILVTLDPASRSAGILSIPRDLWVDIPGFGYHKINQAFQLGEAYDAEGGGAGLTLTTVAGFLDVSIPYYALVDFHAFERFIDEIGGLKLDIKEPILIDPLGDHNTIKLKPGVQTISGDLALAYARARNTNGGDFDRAERQQQVIMAIRDRVISFEMLPTLMSKAPTLYNELSEGLTSNLSLQQFFQFAWVAYQIPEDNIQRYSIGPNEITFGTSADGLDILFPIPEEIQRFRDALFGSSTTPPEPIVADDLSPIDLVKEENARVSVRNGTQTVGLAARTDEYLREVGINVIEVTNADQYYTLTTLIDYTGKPYTLEYLANLLRVSPSNVFHRYDPNSEIDLVVLLGDDWSQNNPLP